MRLTAPAIVLAVRTHGEHGAVVRLLTADHGLIVAYVRGARGRLMRPVLIAGNRVMARLAARTDQQMPHAEVELTHSLAPLLAEPLAAAAIDWVAAVTATALPEGQAYPQIHLALDALLSALEAAPSASGWGTALVRYELLLLAELGFGLDLDSCAVTGATGDLVAVSPRSGRAISALQAAPYAGKLLPLPTFVHAGGEATLADVLDGLALTGHFLLRDLITDRALPVAEARTRLIERLHRATG